MDAPVAFKEVGGWMTAQPSDAAPKGKWWEVFGDARLSALEEQLTRSNPDLAASLARYEQARAAARAARAEYFPSVTGTVHDFRERTSPNYSAISTGKAFNDYLAEADLSYEIDLWGRIRNQVAVAKNQAKASGGDAVALDLSLHAELAQDYFALEADDAQQIVLDETVKAYEKAFQLTRRRFEGGVSAEADLDQAQAQYEGTKTQAQDLRLKRAELEHAVAVLVGEAAGNFTLQALGLAATPPTILPGLPSRLLERRPDVAAAERRVMAANAQIGVARSAWFPDFSIQGLFGAESVSSSNWFAASSRIWSLGPSAALTLFDAGRINAISDEARAQYDEYAADYRKTVLTAYQETEDSLVAIHRLDEELVSQAAAAQAANKALKQFQDRYTGGIITYLDVIVTQNTALQDQLNLIDVRGRRMVASVQLIKALGGSWQKFNAIVPGGKL